MNLNLEEERERLNELILLDLRAGDPEAAAHVRNNIAIQSRLVSALELLEQAREALEHVSVCQECAEMGFAACERGGFEAAMILEALKQQEVGNE